MKKSTILKILLIALPLITIGVESLPNSVSVWWREGLETPVNESCSFFATLSDGTLPTGMAIAGMATGAAFGFAVAYGVSRKKQWLAGVRWTALAAMVIASVSVALQTEPMVLPNVGVYLLLMGEWAVSYFLGKEPEVPQKKTNGKRLKAHK